MKLSIEPSDEWNTGYNCMESNINVILKWKGIDYKKSLIDSWKFKIFRDDNIKTVGDRLCPATLTEIVQGYRKCCGVDFKVHKKETTSDCFDIISSEISNERPLLVYIDSYYCPWLEDYYKYHGGHFCTIVGIDKTNIYCIDVHPIEENGVIKREEFNKRYNSIVALEFNDTNYEYSDLKAVLSECINGLSDSTFDDMRYFADCIDKMNIDTETKGLSYIYSIPVFYKIMGIYNSRYQLTKFIEHLMEYYNEDILKYLLSRFTEISFQWASIKLLTCKAIVSKNDKILSDISEKIRKVADEEERSEKVINDFINNKFVFKSEDNCDLSQVKDFVFVDLTKYFNNKGFEGENASFSRTGQYFLAKGLPDKPVFTVGNVKLSFPDVKNSKYDNISCQGQTIECPSGTFSRLTFLCCAEWGNFIENMMNNYRDGTQKAIALAVSNWFGDPEFQEKVAWSGKAADKSGILKGKHSIYARTLCINEGRKIISSVTLPNCANIHIFAVTLS